MVPALQGLQLLVFVIIIMLNSFTIYESILKKYNFFLPRFEILYEWNNALISQSFVSGFSGSQNVFQMHRWWVRQELVSPSCAAVGGPEGAGLGLC